MDLQEYLSNAMKVSRAKSLDKSDQLTLGELILKLEPIVQKQAERQSENKDVAIVVYDFADTFPTSIDSWRGSYAELALNFETEGKEMTVIDFLKMLKDCIGKEFTGYKGGQFTMHKHTPIWVANYGNSGNTGVIEVIDEDYLVILITGYVEF